MAARYSEDEINSMIQMYTVEKMSLDAISRALKRNHHGIRYQLIKHGINCDGSNINRRITTEESLKKRSDKLKGRQFSEETKKKMSDAKRGWKWSGSDNPNWRGGTRTADRTYDQDFNNRLRYELRAEAGSSCALCSKKEDGRKHSIHHVDYNKLNTDRDNLMVLCTACHGKTNFNRHYWFNLLRNWWAAPFLP
jgi:5-methylcytosine-specific restriction endonuclease McrA